MDLPSEDPQETFERGGEFSGLDSLVAKVYPSRRSRIRMEDFRRGSRPNVTFWYRTQHRDPRKRDRCHDLRLEGRKLHKRTFTNTRESEIIALLLNEDQRLKRETLRGCGFAQTFAHVPTKESKRPPDKGSGKNTRRSKGKQTKGKGKRGKNSKNQGWRPNNNDWSLSWTHGKRNDWNQSTYDQSEGPSGKSKTSDDKQSGDETKEGEKKK